MLNSDSKYYKWIFFLLLIAGMALLFLLQNYLSDYPFYPHQVLGGLLFGILIVVLVNRIQWRQIRSAISVKAKRRFRFRNNWLSGMWILLSCLNLIQGKSSNGFIYSAFLVFWLYQFIWVIFIRGIYFHADKFNSFGLSFYTIKANSISVVEENPEGFEFFYKAFRGSTKLRKDDYEDAEWEKVVYLMKEWCVRNEVVIR